MSIFIKSILGVLIGLCLISLVARFYMTEKLPFVMDELVDTQIACQLEKGSDLYKDYVWVRTPLLNYLIASTVGNGNNSFYTAVSARKVMWLLSLIIFILTFSISRQLHNLPIAITSVAFLASYTTFLDRSIRIRADLLSTLLSLPALWVLLSKKPSNYLFGLAGMFLGIATLSTQKAIYFVIAFGIALLGRELTLYGLNKRFLSEFLKKTILSSLGFFIPIIIFIIWLNVTDQFHQFVYDGIKHAGNAGLFNNTYKEATKVYLKQTIIRNPGIWFFSIVGMILYVLNGIRKNDQNINIVEYDKKHSYIALSLWMLSLMILVFNHKVKFPYVFLNLSPSLAICAAFCFVYFMTNIGGVKLKNTSLFYYAVLFLSSLVVIIPAINRHYENLKDNALIVAQRAIMHRVDDLTALDDYVFDGIGMAVTRRKATPYSMTARWFNERKRRLEYDIIKWLKTNKPIVMILNYRIKYLDLNEKTFISDNYLRDWANVFVVGKRISHMGDDITQKNIDVLAPAVYAIIADYRENVLIDGKTPESTMILNAGSHEVIIRGAKQEIIIKLNSAVKNPLPFQKPFRLYPSYVD